MITFYAKNLSGEICKLTYNHIDEIANLIKSNFGITPLYEPIWIDEDGDEKVPPRNEETVFVLYNFRDINPNFIINWVCDYEEDKYIEYSIVIESYMMENIYEEIVINFYKHCSKNIFYSEKHPIYVHEIDDNHGIKYIKFLDNLDNLYNHFTSIKDLFLSFRENYKEIPYEYFSHLSNCIFDKWEKYYN